MLKDIDLVIFDLDGTLVDSRRSICETFNHVLVQKQLPVADHAVIGAMIGRPLHEMYKTCVPQATAEELDLYFDLFSMAYSGFSRQYTQVMAGVADILPLLSQRKILSVATTKHRAAAVAVLSDSGMQGHFQLVLGADDVSFPKPHPEVIQKTLAHFDIEPQHAVMIGDTTHDLDAGRAAGVHTIGVTTGTHARAVLQGSNPTLIVDSLEELRALL